MKLKTKLKIASIVLTVVGAGLGIANACIDSKLNDIELAELFNEWLTNNVGKSA